MMRNFGRLSSPLRAFLLFIILSSLLLTPTPPASAATYTVNSLNDPGSGVCNATECTLREAIIAANATAEADTIRFSLSGVITLGSSLPAIVSAGGMLTIDGTGRDIDVSGAGAYRPFHVGTLGHLTLKSLDVKNGYSWDGGGVLNAGYLTIQDSTLMGNVAENNGGAIYSTGVLTLTNTILSFNTAKLANGGGVYIEDGAVNVYGGTFQNNRASYSGGAFFNDYQSESVKGQLDIQGALFFGNSADNGDGGAIASESALRINQSTFSLNSAENNGGAVYHKGGDGIRIEKSLFSFNLTRLDNGGGLYLSTTGGTNYLLDSTLTRNDAGADGGGFYNNRGVIRIGQSTISLNEADRNGGGGYNNEGRVSFNRSTVSNNQAAGNGGGFYNNDDMDITSSTFSGNSAAIGGGVYHSWEASASAFLNSTFYNNSASAGGGAFVGVGLDVTNCTFSANSATEGNGGGLGNGVLAHVRNSILANNTGGNCYNGIGLPINEGNNIDSDATCGWGSAKGSMSNTDPLLGPLQNNGGYTQTMMPQKNSPAVDGVTYNPPNQCPGDDQRGHPRPFGLRNDIGAVERYWRIMLPLLKKDN
jgi:CSLREA domain-containing protein